VLRERLAEGAIKLLKKGLRRGRRVPFAEMGGGGGGDCGGGWRGGGGGWGGGVGGWGGGGGGRGWGDHTTRVNDWIHQ